MTDVVAERAERIDLAHHEHVERLALSAGFSDAVAFRDAYHAENLTDRSWAIPAHGRAADYLNGCADAGRTPDATELAKIDPALPADRVAELLTMDDANVSELRTYAEQVGNNSADRVRAAELHTEYVKLTGTGIATSNDKTPIGASPSGVLYCQNRQAPARLRIEPYVTFPVDVLPEPIRSFVAAGAESMIVDPAFIALPLLSALAATIGGARKVSLPGGWSAPSIVWTAIIGESGTRKTPAVELATAPLSRINSEQQRQNAKALKDHEAALDRYDRDKRIWKSSKGHSDPPEKPDALRLIRHVVNDATVEALAPILADNPRGVLVARDELSGWCAGFDRYSGGHGGDRASWLSMWTGAAVTVDRKTGNSRVIHVPSAIVSVTGGIQPGILDRMFDRADRDSGLLARLLVAMPPRRPKVFTDKSIPERDHQRIRTLFERLRDLDFAYDIDGNPEPRAVRLTTAAQTQWRTFVNEHGEAQAAFTGDLAAAYSKLESYAARLALIVHCVRRAMSESPPQTEAVDRESIDAGVTLVQWFAREARRLYAFLGTSDADRAVMPLIEKIANSGGSVGIRDWQRTRAHPTADAAERELRELVEAGLGEWMTPRQDGPGRPPSKRFVLHALPKADETDNTKPRVAMP